MGESQVYASGEGRPKLKSLSQAAVSRAVLGTTVQKPYVLYPTAVGVLGTVAAVLLGPSPFVVVPAVLGGVVGIGSWAFDYFVRREHHASAYLRDVNRMLGDRRRWAIQTLDRELAEVGARDGLAQLARLRQKYDAFEELLNKKLDRKELTHGRYLGMAEQVFLSGLDNLQRVAHTLGSIKAIDEEYVSDRIRAIEALAESSDVQRAELESLRTRLALKASQRDKVSGWLAQNERAMTQIDMTMAAIAAMDTVRGHASTNLETAMAELAELAGRASEYDRKGGPE